MVNKFPRLWDRLSILMIIICIWLPAALLQSTGWAKNLDQVELLALVGVVIGILLGKTALSAGKAHLIFAALSVIIPLGLFTMRMTPEGDWPERLASLGLRAKMAVSQTMTGQVVQDPLVFVMFCAYFFWIIGYFTGYGLTRRWNPWQGLLASAGIFGVIDFYAKSRASSFWIGAALVLLLFLLASRLFWLNRKLTWEREGYFIERDAGESVIRLATILGIILVLFAWNLETIIRSFTPGTTEYERVSDFWKGVQSSLQNNFMALESTTSLTGTYPGGMKLGEQTPSNPEPAFFIDMVIEPSPAPKYYWRVKTFYEYRNGEWQSPTNEENNDAALKPEELTGSNQLSKLAVRYFWQAGDGSVIPYTGRFSTLDIPFRLESSRKPVPVSGDVQVYPLELLTKGDVFHLESAVYTGGPSDLQKINYFVPQEIAASSLQIPETVPKRVRELGVQIAVGDTTAERVMNVTRYLRSQIAYKNRIPTPTCRTRSC